MSKKATQVTSSGYDPQCPYCRGKNKHGPSQRKACKNGKFKTASNGSGTTTGAKP